MLKTHEVWRRPAAFALTLLLLSASAALGAQIQTGPIDNVALQALVDGAKAGDTIVLGGGVYDFFTTNAPVRITKRLRIVADDPANPPVLVGDGTVATPFDTGNNGFLIYELASDLHNVQIDGIHFSSFDRSIGFGPGFPGAITACNLVAPGTLRAARVKNCRFSNSRRGVQSFGGQVENLSITNNVFDQVTQAVLLIGGAVGCTDPPFFFDAGRSIGTRVVGNHILGGNFGILAAGVEKALVQGNLLEGTGIFGIALGDDLASFLPDDGPIDLGAVIGNELRDQFVCAINAFGPTTMKNVLIANNTIAGSFFVGICLEQGANGMQLSNNDISGVTFRADFGDINLGDATVPAFGTPPATHDNKVITTDFDTLVFDGGINNRILGTSAPD